MTPNFPIYLLSCALVTYLIRMLPLVLVKKKIKNSFLLSFLYYVPYAVLSVMTIPAILYATEHTASAVVGLITALVAAYKEKSLLTVAALSCMAVFAAEITILYIV